MAHIDSALERGLAAAIRVELAARQWTQKDLAGIIGVGREAIGRYMRGERNFPLPTVVAISDAFEMELSELIAKAESLREI